MAITVTPTTEPTNVPPRIRLNVAASAGETSTTVTRQDPDGTVLPVRTTDGGPLPISAGTGLVYDYEAPFGQSVTFSSQETPANVSAPVTVAISDVWLIHPGTPALSMPITLRPGTLLEETLTVKQAAYWPQGRSTPIVVSDGARKASQSSLVITTPDATGLSALRALVADAGVVLLNVPPSVGAMYDTCYIAPSEVKIRRFTDTVIDSNRDVTMPFYVVDRPAGGTQAQRTLADLLVYATLADIKAAYATLNNILTGP